MRRRRGGLADDEYRVVHCRAHGRVLAWPVLALFALAAGLGVLLAALPAAVKPIGTWALVVLFALAALALVLMPVLRWASTTYTVTSRRIMVRTGIVRRAGVDVALNRVTEISYRRSLADRVFGSGTVVIDTQGPAPLRLRSVPDLAGVQRMLGELVYAVDDGQGQPM
ncbi:PH domain-containing protein [uncultured Propionibacterium sp.]|uniref:PH domain-containing protein n=1 Tax=uncultured Propionibacterium sp. TaxID=218066 RepID=UPI00292E613B|nr:PH domain-containing protein [uncultured Propionibacterium sp.]